MANHILSYSNAFELSLPDDWKTEDNTDCIQFTKKEKGYGVLSLSFATDLNARSKDEIKEDVLNQLERFIAKMEPTSIQETLITFEDQNNGYILVTGSFINKLQGFPTYWKVWFLYGSKKLFRITYTCDFKDKSKEIEVVQDIIYSIIIY
jgi:hypothetical protein